MPNWNTKLESYGRLAKICKIEPPDLLFLGVFNSFYKFLELHSVLSVKKICHEFSFLTDSIKPPTTLMAKIC